MEDAAALGVIGVAVFSLEIREPLLVRQRALSASLRAWRGLHGVREVRVVVPRRQCAAHQNIG
jgi:hypothetical protein